MGLLKEFKEFAMRGNVVDMAVGFVIGAAFTKIVTSLVNDMIMPPLGLLTGKADSLSSLSLPLSKDAEVAIKYGVFLETVFQFLIVALAVFILVKAMNMLRRNSAKQAEVAPAPTKDQVLLTEIRDLLKARA